ncbi:hypothetical protein A6302_02452 [Methylobrevis pamukkalensis]|uniref:Lipoprotein n=2 Tax=Methylobrevis pamukkalensis TaxID=1439726 RepID=A0A1E3H3Y5_9HYPH|nr:hypothetical protein A6302_02452 [Methylobrevis pamukkalensis]
MKRTRVMASGLALLGLAACVTTEQAGQAITARWIGQPSDAFFVQYGPPRGSYVLANGDTIHTWRGGETTKHVPAQYAPVATAAPTFQPPAFPSTTFPSGATFPSSTFQPSSMPSSTFGSQRCARPAATVQSAAPLYGRQVTKTETKVENPRPGVTRTTTTTTSRSASVNFNPSGLFGAAPSSPPPPPGQRLVSAARTEQLFCELQITTAPAPDSIIKAIRISRDTGAAGIGLSRCAEVMGVK